MPGSSHVTDHNKPYLNFLDAMLAFEDLTVSIGIQPRFRYPKGYRKGRTENAQERGPRGTAKGSKGGNASPAKLRYKVARIGHIWNFRSGWMTETWDRLESTFQAKVGEMHKKAIAGEMPQMAARQLGAMYQKHYQNAIQQMGLVQSGKLRDSISVDLKDQAEVARRKAAKLKRIAQGK